MHWKDDLEPELNFPKQNWTTEFSKLDQAIYSQVNIQSMLKHTLPYQKLEQDSKYYFVEDNLHINCMPVITIKFGFRTMFIG